MTPDAPSSRATEIAPPLPRGSIVRRTADALRSLFGLHRRIVVDGVRYTERSAETLRRALTRRGSGRKDYDVVFPGGESMRIRVTPEREYADLVGAKLRPVYALVEPLIRPGMRVLDAAAGTGYGAAWLAERIGPSGALVALDRDRESVRYAAARYRASNAAFECGWLDALAGETDGSFDGVLCCDAIRAGDDPEKALRELWRLVGPGGWLLLAAPAAGNDTPRTGDSPHTFTSPQLVELVRAAVGAVDREEPASDGKADTPGKAEVEPSALNGGGRLVVVIRRPDR